MIKLFTNREQIRLLNSKSTDLDWVGVWLVGWMGGLVGELVGSCQITKYRINLDLNRIIQFCLKIYDLWRCNGWVNGLVDGWGQVKFNSGWRFIICGHIPTYDMGEWVD